MTDQGAPVGDTSNAMLKKLEGMEQRLTRELESLQKVKAEVDALETVASDEKGAVTVTIAGAGEIKSLEISATGLRMREALGPLVTQMIARAQEEHADKLQALRPHTDR